jgi:hypothetical protein
LDSRSRLLGANVDIGAYESQGPELGAFIGWLEHFGLPTDGSADDVDQDHDRASAREEWRAGTDPTDTTSVLRLDNPVLKGDDLLLIWSTVPGRSYSLWASSGAGTAASFSPLISNIVAQAVVTTTTHTNAARQGPKFYHVIVE